MEETKIESEVTASEPVELVSSEVTSSEVSE